MSELLYEQNPLERIADYMQIIAEKSGGGEEGGDTPSCPIPILDLLDPNQPESDVLIEFPTDHSGDMIGYCLMRIVPPDAETPPLYIPAYIDWDDENKEGFLVWTGDYAIYSGEEENSYISNATIAANLLRLNSQGLVAMSPLTPEPEESNEHVDSWVEERLS